MGEIISYLLILRYETVYLCYLCFRIHHDRYLSFEYDNGGWNNVRMSLECLIVVAHAMGRTLVTPPQQHLYLLGKTHKDAHDEKPHDEMGFEDFFDMDLLRSHKGDSLATKHVHV
jgi:hypothetical protein